MRAAHFSFILAAYVFTGISGWAAAQGAASVPDVFARDRQTVLVMQVEAAIATAQAEQGVISPEAASEIADKAALEYAPLDEIDAEYRVVRHRMVALLNVWRRSMSQEAQGALHLGITTVDIYDTVLVLQLLEASEMMLTDLQGLEQDLVCAAETYKDTPMIGRTLGQHALPITFGKKLAVSAAQTRRNIERLHEVRARMKRSGVLKGAVGTHLGLGPRGVEIEQRVSEILGLDTPEPADWRSARDVFAEYALTLGLIAKSQANFGGEIFRLQMSDIGEVYERRVQTAVGSSTMPQKQNPNLSEALIHYGRTIPRKAEIILDDVESVFERDNTSRPNRGLEEISVEAADMISDSRRLVLALEVDPDRMRRNIDLTGGLVMSQRLVLHLAGAMDREEAERRVRDAAGLALLTSSAFRSVLLQDELLGPKLEGVIDELLDPATYIGLSSDQVDRTQAWIAQQRQIRAEPPLMGCDQARTGQP